MACVRPERKRTSVSGGSRPGFQEDGWPSDGALLLEKGPDHGLQLRQGPKPGNRRKPRRLHRIRGIQSLPLEDHRVFIVLLPV